MAPAVASSDISTPLLQSEAQASSEKEGKNCSRSTRTDHVAIQVAASGQRHDNVIIPDHWENILRIDKESLISTTSATLIGTTSETLIQDPDEEASLVRVCEAMEIAIRGWYLKFFEDFLNLYQLFTPYMGSAIIRSRGLTREEVEYAELTFLQALLFVMRQCNFKIVSDDESAVALSGNFKLNIPISVNKGKLDSSMLPRFFAAMSQPEPFPEYATQYLLFRRGLGTDHTSGYFINEKIDLMLARLWDLVLKFLCLRSWRAREDMVTDLRNKSSPAIAGPGSRSKRRKSVVDADVPRKRLHEIEDSAVELEEEEGEGEGEITVDGEGLIFERLRFDNIKLSWRNIISKMRIQDGMFHRVMVLYRPVVDIPAPPNKGDGKGSSISKGSKAEAGGKQQQKQEEQKDWSICLRQFSSVPMSDLEVVLPEKETPGLTIRDCLTFTITILTGLVALFGSLKLDDSATLTYTILVGVVCYAVKVYAAWSSAQSTYKEVIDEFTYNRQLDSGRGTLLHLCADLIEQEVKEASLAYFVLLKEGKATAQELQRRSEVLLEQRFGEFVKFDVADAINKLTHFRLLQSKKSDTEYEVKGLSEAMRVLSKDVTSENRGRCLDISMFEPRPKSQPRGLEEAAGGEKDMDQPVKIEQVLQKIAVLPGRIETKNFTLHSVHHLLHNQKKSGQNQSKTTDMQVAMDALPDSSASAPPPSKEEGSALVLPSSIQ